MRKILLMRMPGAGKGITTEAVKSIIKYAFKKYKTKEGLIKKLNIK